MPDYHPDYVPDYIPDYIPSYISDRISDHIPDYHPDYISDHIPSCIPDCIFQMIFQKFWLNLSVCLHTSMEALQAHLDFRTMPAEIGIGTMSAWKNNDPFMYRMVQVHEDYGVYVCNKVTDYGLPGEMMFIIGDGTYWYACEGIWQDGNQTIRQAVFRTQENSWEKR